MDEIGLNGRSEGMVKTSLIVPADGFAPTDTAVFTFAKNWTNINFWVN